jgi:hypothetical protein
MYFPTKDLPDTLRAALRSVAFNRDSVEISPSETYCVGNGGAAFTGNRSYTLAVNLSTGETQLTQGSWGGANPFVHAQADHDDTQRPLPQGFAIVQGESGGRGSFARVYVHPSTFAPLLPTGEAIELSPDESLALAAVRSLNSKGRADCFARKNWTKDRINETLNSLAAKGLVERNKAGATKITTEGRNRSEGLPVPY